ncbi:MAG: hypothetical protein R3251_04335 [Candidatus Spechtbacterales bacterium]|nr:hypothetical protein [Candidatus Spechtbacterales bacterium]
MREQDIIKNLEQLKNVKPNEDWASSARQNLLTHIENTAADQPSVAGHKHSWFERTLAQPKWAMAFTAVIFVLMVGTAIVSQNGGEINENLYAQKLEQVEQKSGNVMKIASTKLEKEEAEVVAQSIENYKKDIEKAKESGDEQMVEQKLAQAQESVDAWTNIVSTEDPAQALEDRVEELYASCGDEKLLEEADELLEEGGWLNMVNAFELLNRCENDTEDLEEPGEETSADPGEEPKDLPEGE